MFSFDKNRGKLNKITYGNGFSVSCVYNVLELLTEVWYNYTDGITIIAIPTMHGVTALQQAQPIP